MPGPELSVTDAGEGVPVILLHGLTACRRYVVMGSRALERSGHRVLAYDARGHGQSPPGDGYAYPQLADDLRRVLDDSGLERAVLAGASMGAHTALRLALDAPERVAGLIVITPASHPDAAPDLDRWDRLADGLRGGGVDGFVEAYDLAAVPEAWRTTIERVLRQRMAAHAHPEAVADALSEVPRSTPYALEELAEVACPTVIVADRDEADPGHPLWVGKAYAQAIPGATLRVEDEGQSPLAWQGGQLSRVIAELAACTDLVG